MSAIVHRGILELVAVNEKAARTAATGSPTLQAGIRLGDAQELTHGWFFPFVSTTVAGCNGVIVNKQTGALFHLGSAFPLERDLELYDRGYQFEAYELVILEVRDRGKTLDALQSSRFRLVEPVLEHGTTWRIPRDMTRDELSTSLEVLPRTFADVSLYFKLELLEEARAANWFVFELREHARTQ